MFLLPAGCWQTKVTHSLIIMKTQFPPTEPTREELSRQVAFSPVSKSHGEDAGVAQSKGLETRVCVVKWHSKGCDTSAYRLETHKRLLTHKVAGTESRHFYRRNNELCAMQSAWVASWPIQFIKETRSDPQWTDGHWKRDRFFVCALQKGQRFLPYWFGGAGTRPQIQNRHVTQVWQPGWNYQKLWVDACDWLQRTIPATCTFGKRNVHFIPYSYSYIFHLYHCPYLLSVCMHVDCDWFHDQKQVQPRQSYRCHSSHTQVQFWTSFDESPISFVIRQLGRQAVFLLQPAPLISARNCFPSSMLTIPSQGPSGHPPARGFNISNDNFLSSFACAADTSDSLLAHLADNVSFSTVVNCPSWKVQRLRPRYRPFSAFLDSAADDAEHVV